MPRLDSNERLIIGLTLALKVGVLLLGVIAWQWVHGGHVDFPGLSLWDRWDAPHYTDLMVYGYRADDPGNLTNSYGYQQVYPGDLGLYIVFYPLFPWLGGLVNALFHAPVLSAFLVAGVASLFVGPLLYRLVRHDEPPDVALRSAWFLLIFPTAYFLHIGYTEALFMALVLGSFLAARGERWWLAGLIGGLAALTRINGLVLLLALPVEAATQWYMAPPGERRFRWSWLGIGLVGTLIAAFRFRPSWFAWMLGNLVLFVSTSFLLSTPRYALTLFPLFVALALPTRRIWALVPVSALSLVGFIYFASRFATGAWAF